MKKQRSILDLLKEEDWKVHDYNSNVSIIPAWEEEKKRSLVKDEADKKEFPRQYDGYWKECAMKYGRMATEAKEEAERLEKEIADIRQQIKASLGL